MPRSALAYLPIPAPRRPVELRPEPRRKHLTPFSRYPRVQPKPRLGVKNYAPQNAPGSTPKTHANPPGITPVAEDAVVGCSVAAESATVRAVRLGAEGEQAVGLFGPKVGIRIPGANNLRFPDNLTTTTLTEVKNVASQGLTKQLRDYITVSQSTGRTFDLYVRGPLATGGRTNLTQTLADAIRRGDINLHYIPGTF
jgi:Restriction endonuclease fold toxin 7